MSDKKSKAELLEMLAEAVRNTQPQQPGTKPKARNTQPARKPAVKIKRVRRYDRNSASVMRTWSAWSDHSFTHSLSQNLTLAKSTAFNLSAASTSIERWQISASCPFSPSTTFMN
jgi:ribosomal protein S7